MSQIQLDAYLFFKDKKCREAMEFYKEVFGGELSMQTYAEGMGEEFDRSEEVKNHSDKIMHAMLSGGAIRLMASDSTNEGKFGQSFISLSLSGSDEEKLTEFFNKLTEGGKVDMPLEKAPWGDTFGGLTDKFGVEWMVNINSK